MMIYLVVAIAILAVGFFITGQRDDEELIAYVLVCGLLWPLVLALAIVSAPFIGVYWLGRWVGNRR